MAAEVSGTEPANAAGPLRRAARLGRTIVAMHVEVAAKEAARDRKRIGGGIVCVVFGGLLIALLLVMAHVAATCAVHEYYGRSWSLSALAIAAGDLVLGLLFLAVGRRRLRGPIMAETRNTVRRTVEALWDD